MSDSKQTKTTSAYFTFMPLFTLAGFALHPIFFLGMVYCLISAQSTRKNKIAMAAFSLIGAMLVFSYTIGKDMAIRDNERDAKTMSQQKAP